MLLDEDMGRILGMFLLLVLAIFVVWESRRFHSRRPDPLARDKMNRGVTPGAGVGTIGMVAIAAMFFIMGLEEWAHPKHPPFHGRGAFFWATLYAALGPRGAPVIEWILGGGFAAAAVANWRRK